MKNESKDRKQLEPLRGRKSGAWLLTSEQIKALLYAARGHPLEAFITVAMTTGLRSGELLGLQWQDIDLENQQLHVCRAVSWHQIRELRAPGEGERIVALPRIARNAFNLQRSQQEEARRSAGVTWHNHDLVFPNAVGNYSDPNRLRQQVQALLAEAGLPCLRLHDLRLNTAAFLLVTGTPAHIVQSILGFHWIPTQLPLLVPPSLAMQREAMNKWDELLLEE
jgi:integrase